MNIFAVVLERVYCRMPPSQGRQVTVDMDMGRGLPNVRGIAHWLKPPTYWATKNIPNNAKYTPYLIPTSIEN